MEEPKPVVAYLGPEASYTHQAALSAFPAQHVSLHAQSSIAAVFTAVQARTVTHGVVPFENSSNGSVVFTLDLLADVSAQTHSRHSDICVVAEVYVPISHCLLSRAASLERVAALYSHPQAWGQCKRFLEGAAAAAAERVDVSSTSRAAELVAALPDEAGAAAISSALAADKYGLPVLARAIEDRPGENSTRFLVLRNRRDLALVSLSTLTQDEGGAGADIAASGHDKSLVTFTVSHGTPGALADCLAVFKKHGLNLTNFTSRPSGDVAWNYVFFVEFRGKRGSPDVEEALRELEGAAERWRWLGSWESRS